LSSLNLPFEHQLEATSGAKSMLAIPIPHSIRINRRRYTVRVQINYPEGSIGYSQMISRRQKKGLVKAA
jgi:hypothetical protein